MSYKHLDWPRLSYREQYKEGDEEADTENDGKNTIRQWTDFGWNDLLRKAEDRGEWRKLVSKSSVVLPQSTGLRDR